MATGDQSDMAGRVFAQLPPWFDDGENDPILNSALQGAGSTFSWIYGLVYFVKSQMRLLSQTGGFIDMTAYDFFRTRFLRRSGELDPSFISRIQKEIFRPRATRAAITEALVDLTGTAPDIIEPWNPNDCGAYDVPSTLGYDVVGVYGTFDKPTQILVRAYNVAGATVANAPGYDENPAAYDIGTTEYIDVAALQSALSEDDIYATVAGVQAAGVTSWTQVNPTKAPSMTGQTLDLNNTTTTIARI